MTIWTPQRRARAALTFVCEAAKPELSQLVAEVGADTVWNSLRTGRGEGAWPRRARALDVDALIHVATQCGARLVVPEDDEWPELLNQLDTVEPLNNMRGAPVGLWVRGDMRLDEFCSGRLPAVAMVGARAATRYGENVASNLAGELARQFGVISGGAYGIDAAAHRGALEADGRTMAIMAGGLDQWYPRGNGLLLDRIARECLVVSEIAPGVRPTRAGFLARNRLIAAMAGGTILVEAAMRSGAVNTANWTNRLTRPLMAVPGPISSALSDSPHRLIRDHEANLVSSADDVRALITPVGECVEVLGRSAAMPMDQLEPALLTVREAMPARGSIDVDSLSVAAGCSAAECASALIQLEMAGWVEQTNLTSWRITRRSGSRQTVRP